VPTAIAEQLDEKARVLDISKSRLVADLVVRHLGPDGPPVGIDSLRGAPVGRHSFTPAHELEVLTLDQLAALLEVDVGDARELAEAGELPGRKIGEHWRFSRRAVMAWLAGE
jgi:excisionase family DNA binding protein